MSGRGWRQPGPSGGGGKAARNRTAAKRGMAPWDLVSSLRNNLARRGLAVATVGRAAGGEPPAAARDKARQRPAEPSPTAVTAGTALFAALIFVCGKWLPKGCTGGRARGAQEVCAGGGGAAAVAPHHHQPTTAPDKQRRSQPAHPPLRCARRRPAPGAAMGDGCVRGGGAARPGLPLPAGGACQQLLLAGKVVSRPGGGELYC